MYSNLKAEMTRKNINNIMLAECLKQHPSTMTAKLNRYDRIKLHEAMKIRDSFFPNMEIDYLFATENAS